MKRTWTWTWTAFGAAAVVALGLFWLNFAPTRLGGDSIYVVTSGISMEPRFHTGDLAILRPASSYEVGEIVGYKSPHIGIVLHRIIGEKGGHFLMKGDNNDFVDPYHPVPSDVVGKLWVHVPKVGRLINSQRNREISVAVAAVAMAGIVAVPTERKRQRRRKNAGRDGTAKGFRPPSHRSRSGGPTMAVIGLPGQVAASIICVVALVALVLGAFSYTRSTTAVTTEHLSYRQTGTWSYSAHAKGNVYANGVVTTGQPIFLAVAPVVKVDFAYRFISALPASLTGQAGLVAVLTSSDGWSQTLPVGPKTSFSGTQAQLTGTLNLPAIEKLLASIATQTGTGAGVSYTLALEPTVQVSGLLGGSSLLGGSFNPPLSFSLAGDEAQLYLGQDSSTTTLAQLVQPSAAGSVSLPRTTSANLSFLGLHPSVSASREVAAWVLLACLLALMGLGFLLWKASRAPETDRIAARYGPILVAVERPEALGGAGSVRVANVEDLVKIAEHEGRMILHCEGESGRDYFVQDQSLTYLYSVREQPSGRGPVQASATYQAASEGITATEVAPVVTPNMAVNHADVKTSPEDQA
ncbi:MAG: signal peptidase I [Acidimicrobiales bacterium]